MQADGRPRLQSWFERGLPFGAALAGILLYHRYTIFSGLDLVQADTGDSRFIAFILEHWNAVFHGRAPWASPPFFYPERGTLAYSDLLLGMGVLQALLRQAGLGPFAAMNAQEILLSALAFAACHRFLRRGFLLGVPASCAGAWFFAFGWPRFAQLVHVQLQFTAPLPLLALLALRVLRDGEALRRIVAFRILAAAAILLALLLATASYYAFFFVLALGIAVVLCLVRRDGRRRLAAVLRRQALPLAGASLLLALLLAPLAWFYAPVMRASGGRQWAEISAFLCRPSDLFWMGRESYLWGWLFGRDPARALANWPETRIGVGLAVSLIWFWAVCAALRSGLAQRVGRSGVCGAAAIIILTGALMQLCMLRFGGFAPWRLVYHLVPGLSGVRGVPRLQLVAMLPMALGLALFVERMLAPERRRLRPALLLLLGLAAAEQQGRVFLYSGRQAEALSRRVAAAVPAHCAAFYVVAAPGAAPVAPVIAFGQFDANAYLRANPDVARDWKGTAWQHYQQFGRAEHRFLDPAVARRYYVLSFFYRYTILAAAQLAGKPAVNGLSGWTPPGYDLSDPLLPGAAARLHAWLAGHGLRPDAACLVPVALATDDLPQSGQ